MRIVIIGRGNVATNLQYVFEKQHIPSQMHSSREGLSALPDADVYIYAVRDEALQNVISEVAAGAEERMRNTVLHALHVHTSGTMPLSVFGEAMPHAGILYFFQSFSKSSPLESFAQIPVFVEGKQTDDVGALFSLAQLLTPHVYEASQHDRERLHVAGVFANNFTNRMYAIAADLLRDTSIPFQALLPLIDQTAAKVHLLRPCEAQTGPAKRHDERVMQHHLSLLQTEEQRTLYRLVSKMIQEGDAR